MFHKKLQACLIYVEVHKIGKVFLIKVANNYVLNFSVFLKLIYSKSLKNYLQAQPFKTISENILHYMVI